MNSFDCNDLVKWLQERIADARSVIRTQYEHGDEMRSWFEGHVSAFEDVVDMIESNLNRMEGE